MAPKKIPDEIFQILNIVVGREGSIDDWKLNKKYSARHSIKQSNLNGRLTSCRISLLAPLRRIEQAFGSLHFVIKVKYLKGINIKILKRIHKQLTNLKCTF